MKVESSRFGTMFMVGLLALGAVACGDSAESGQPPVVEQPQIDCGEYEGDDRDVQHDVVQQVSVTISDPDGDLVVEGGTVDGTINGVQMQLTDDDADEVYTWSPTSDVGPLTCDGSFRLMFSVQDQEGQRTDFDELVSPNASDEG